MVRLEIVGNVSLEQDLLDSFEDAGLDFYYTKLSGVKGKGDQGQKQMDSVWPEENFMIITYIEESQADKITEIVYDIKCAFPKEGINVFQVKSMDWSEPARVKEAQANANKSLADQARALEAEIRGQNPVPAKGKKLKSEACELKETVVSEGSLF